MSLILASASPRRRELLSTAGVPVAGIRPADIDETPKPGEAALAFALRMAEEKADTVAADVSEPVWILAADTVVHTDEVLLGKPQGAEEAMSMLRTLSGCWHTVTTGWALAWGGPERRRESSGVVSARVRFRTLSEAEQRSYVATGEPFDKAGGYGVQGLGAAIVAEVRGDYSTVVGLPMEAVLAALSRRGIVPVEPS